MRIGIVGYGNLGKAIELRAQQTDEFEIAAVFSRRKIQEKDYIYPLEAVDSFKGKIDCLLLAGGSSSDLPHMSPMFAEDFNVVDSFDTHSLVKKHYLNVDISAKRGNHSAIICCGWDPGFFSIFRLYVNSFLENAKVSSFWGKGVSQGHTEAIKRIDGVIDAVQYTVPLEDAVESAFRGEDIYTVKSSHMRECYVAAVPGFEREIEEKIKRIPGYFDGYKTRVFFIKQEELLKEHSKKFHAGRVVAYSKSTFGDENEVRTSLNLSMDSNPEFTAGIMLSFARAAKILFEKEIFGAKTPFDIPPSYLLPRNNDTFNLL